jgi:gas vesicle protein
MRRSWLIAAAVVVVAAVVAVIAVVLVRNSNSESSPPSTEAWAGQVCTSLSKWRTSITSLADVSGATLDRDTLREKLTDAQVATEQLITDLQNIGPPETTSGTQLKQQLQKQGDEIQKSYENLKAGAQNALDASTTVDFLRRLSSLAPDFQKLLNQISTTIDTLQSSNVAGDSADEVRQGFENAESCKKLRS